jgi:hypothetical protein
MISQKVIFTKSECDSIISILKQNEIKWKSNNRKYNSYDLNINLENKWIFDRLKEFFEIETNLKINKMKELIHFHKYIIGDWFGKHNDIREGRLYAVGVLLNQNFDGGDFKLYNPDEYLLNKEIGNTYIFDVKIEHEITTILIGERYSLLWFLSPDNIKSNIKSLI